MYDRAHHSLLLPYKSNSSCVLAMLNPRLELKTVLLANAVEAFREELRRISTMFPQALITVGYIPWTTNPADALTKIFKDPIEIMNSPIYRYRPESFGTREGLGQDVVATCKAGVFQYLGLPSRFFQEPQEEAECVECLGGERCAVVHTRAMQKRDEAMQKKDKTRASYLKWENSIRTLGQEDHWRNLLDHQYTFSLNLTLSREMYMTGGPPSFSSYQRCYKQQQYWPPWSCFAST